MPFYFIDRTVPIPNLIKMKKQCFFTLLLLFPFILSAQSFKKVLYIGIDGCRPDALEIANTPHLDQLIQNGLYSPDALNDDITISGPGWSAMLCGVTSDKHLVTNNNFDGNNYESYPSFFQFLNNYNPSLHTVSFCHWSPINDFIIGEEADFKLNINADLELANQAASYLTLNNPDVMFLHFDDIDGVGHSFGFSPDQEEYIDIIEKTDSCIGMVTAALQQRPNYAEEDWLILVSTDHGGIGTGHGGNTFEEQNVFVIASSPSIPTSLITKDSSLIIDSVEDCLENEYALTFDGNNDFVNVPQNEIFNFGDSQDFTIECRVRLNNTGDFAIIGNKNWESGINPGFIFSFKYPAGPEWKVNIGDGNNRVDINTGGSIADNEWHTLSVSFDRDGWMKMYQDGIIIDSSDISFIGNIDTGQGLFFGADLEGNFNTPAQIAEVRTWNTVLPEDIINEWHCISVDAGHPHFDKLLGYWKMNNINDGINIQDSSPNSNTANNNGANWTETNTEITIYNYDNTPRLTDLVPTLLHHLCIPIQEEWELEGNSLIPDCIVSTTLEQNNTNNFSISPNPVKDIVQIQCQELIPIRISLSNTAGNILFNQQFSQKNISIDLSSYTSGIYWISIYHKDHVVTQKIIKQ